MYSKQIIKKLRDLLPWQRKGYEVIDRYDSSVPSEGDRKVLEQLVVRGADLMRERHVVHYLYFPDDNSRINAAERLRSHSYITRNGVDHSPSELPKTLIAERTGIVNEAVIENERVLLAEIAEGCQGEYDGWEAALD